MKKKINIKVLIVILFLAFFSWLSKKGNYLESEIISVDIKTKLLIFGLLFVFSFIFFLYFDLGINDKIIRVLQSFAFSVFTILIAFLIFPQLLNIGMKLNRMHNCDTISEKYVVSSKGFGLEIISLESGITEHIYSDQYEKNEFLAVHEMDTITLDFGKGIFGKKFLIKNKLKLRE